MFNTADASMGLAQMSHINSVLNKILGDKAWLTWELETISFELKLELDELTRDKIHVLQIIGQNPSIFYEDVSFFLHATDVFNNKVADFDMLPMPTSLELAYAIEESKLLDISKITFSDPNSDIVQVLAYALNDEGYSEPLYPFTFIPQSMLSYGQTPEDTEAKKIAIETYLHEMKNL